MPDIGNKFAGKSIIIPAIKVAQVACNFSLSDVLRGDWQRGQQIFC